MHCRSALSRPAGNMSRNAVQMLSLIVFCYFLIKEHWNNTKMHVKHSEEVMLLQNRIDDLNEGGLAFLVEEEGGGGFERYWPVIYSKNAGISANWCENFQEVFCSDYDEFLAQIDANVAAAQV